MYGCLLSFLYCLFERLVVKREWVFDRRMKLFVSVVFLLAMIQLLSLIHSNFYASQNKDVWFGILSMVYLYFPMLIALYVYVTIDDMGKFRLMVNVFFMIICGQDGNRCGGVIVPVVYSADYGVGGNGALLYEKFFINNWRAWTHGFPFSYFHPACIFLFCE